EGLLLGLFHKERLCGAQSLIGNCFSPRDVQYSKNKENCNLFKQNKELGKGNGKKQCGIIGEISEFSYDG
ncbi:MAG: hypothetical protein HW390_3099, partial [Candidatus Brocadiaceae bacterium]|nr:hypothetical protein [Candidatus Brocadiaceae bacterium]